MLSERRKTVTESNTSSNQPKSSYSGPNSAGFTARSCSSETKLRVPSYCEENVWRLCYRRLYGSLGKQDKQDDIGNDNESYHVAFISNEQRCCPMLNQRASKSPEIPCLWDYHVILIQSTKGFGKHNSQNDVKVLDVDTHLPYSCSLEEYLDGSFGDFHFTNETDSNKYAPMFRVVRAELYLQHFYSDRMHMRSEDGGYLATPPKYDCITTPNMKVDKKGNLSNLDDYIDMQKMCKSSAPTGKVLTLRELRATFGLD